MPYSLNEVVDGKCGVGSGNGGKGVLNRNMS